MQNNDNFERIKQFLNNEMSSEERKSFEEEIKNDDELQNQVTAQELITAGLVAIERERLKEKAMEWSNASNDVANNLEDKRSNNQASHTNKIFTTNRLVTFVALVLIATLIAFLLSSKNNADPKELVNQYLAVRHQDPVVLRGGTDNAIWQDAIAHYRKDQFDQMINTMQVDIFSNNANIEQLFYFGLAYLYKNPSQLDSALYYFDKTDINHNQSLKDEASWYTSLILIKQGKLSAAKTKLQLLTQAKNPFQNKAAELLKSIENQN